MSHPLAFSLAEVEHVATTSDHRGVLVTLGCCPDLSVHEEPAVQQPLKQHFKGLNAYVANFKGWNNFAAAQDAVKGIFMVVPLDSFYHQVDRSFLASLLVWYGFPASTVLAVKCLLDRPSPLILAGCLYPFPLE